MEGYIQFANYWELKNKIMKTACEVKKMAEKKKTFIGKCIDKLDEKLEKKSKEKKQCCCGGSSDESCCK